MKTNRTKEKIRKIVAVFLALTLINQFVFPTVCFALTSGPSQPEVESFEPVSTNQMVDLFSGDFNYNIPLLTVPGPNGGYPVNLAYHAGISMEQEASWVGLGWNINPGVITRNMRGLPDDLSGEKVEKTFSVKPNITAGFSTSSLTWHNNIEVFGFDAATKTKTFQIRYNSYKGLGYSYSSSKTFGHKSKENPDLFAYEGLRFMSGVDFDSQNGIGVQPSISFAKQIKSSKGIRYNEFSTGMKYHSRSGISALTLQAGRHRIQNAVSKGAGMSFSAGSFVPKSTNSLDGFSASGFFKSGPSAGPVHFSKATEVFISFEGILDKYHDYPAYGYLYSQERGAAEDDALMDFNRTAEFAITKDAPSLPVPIMTNDVYSVTGQGMGMTFRPYRSDVGVLYDPRQTSDFGSARLGNEPSAPPQHGGFNLAVSYTHSYSGKWKDKWDELDGTYEFNSDFYFKAAGEQTADADAYGETDRFGGESPVDFRIGTSFDGTLSWEPEVYNKRPRSNVNVLTYNNRSQRARRSQNIEYRTRGQIFSSPDYNGRSANIYSENAFPSSSVSGSQYDFTQTYSGKVKEKQLGDISILNPEGSRYVYGIPVYNISDKSAFFSIDQPSTFSRTTTYSSQQASTNNNSGSEHLYSSTEMPPYAYAYLLTAIYSPDYVDVTGNGPSEDDLGYYVKFNYTKIDDNNPTHNNYRWRSPYFNASYDQGFHSNDKDDKAAYSFGEKEIYFMNSIETKTHIAEFQISPRKDGFGAAEEDNLTTNGYGQAQRKLDEIRLFSKANRITPLKTVHFVYSYNLCGNVDNNDNTADASLNVVDGNTKQGKLTLTQVYFTYKNNKKGSLSPYKFYYREDLPAYNPDYNLDQMDCWGNYKPDELVGASQTRNEEFPYVDQNIDNRDDVDKYAAAWNLYQVTLPSGGQITVDYESDDYAYVQNKLAMQMCPIEFTGKESDGDITRATSQSTLGETDADVNNRLYFTLPIQSFNTADISKYIDGLTDMYFKVYMKVPKVQDNQGGFTQDNYDYVEGYCKIDPTKCGIDITSASSGGYTRGFVYVKSVSVTSLNLGNKKVHPIRKATWEYLKMHRNDLLYPSNPFTDDDILSLNAFESIVSLFNDFSSMLLGYYNACLIKGFSKEMEITSAHPSVIRLNNPIKCKAGGGHRVKKISISDKWSALTSNAEADFSYGQEYIYTARDFSSYGVAEYEPMIGGAENPLHLPTDKFSTERRMMLNDKSFYMEYPLCEAYYPGANVGYSKVIVRNLSRLDQDGDDINKKTASGYAVTEFYTAKDFPVREYPTEVQHKQYTPFGIFIPFIGQQEFNNNGYSQGYSVELNDMHGKLKAQSSFAFNSDYTDPDKAVSCTEFIYNTTSDYNPNATNRLLNLVTVLDGDADYRMAMMGQQIDFFYDMDQHSTTSLQAGLQTNVDDAAIGTFIPTFIPTLNYSFSMFRSVVAMKVINKTGILVETRSRNQSSQCIAKSLMFDSKTGAPVLTSVTNDFDAPVYTYNFPAHWYYDAMGAASENYNFTLPNVGNVNTGNYYVFNSLSGYDDADLVNYFSIGDKLRITNGSGTSYCWVASFNNSGYGVRLIDESGITVPVGAISFLQVVRSGRTNQTATTSGTIVSLQNPVTEPRIFPLFSAFNTALHTSEEMPASVTYEDCASGESKTIYITTGPDYIKFTDDLECVRCECEGFIRLAPAVLALDFHQLVFTKRGKKVLIEYTGTPQQEFYGTWEDENHCYPECMDNVLHAEAYRFTDKWTFDYTDANAPASLIGKTNGYRYGFRGIWRGESSYAFQVDRKQSSPQTDIAKDGTYENFVLFHWDPENPHSTTNYDNPQWTFASAQTKYSPYGFNIEERNALNIYSAALYGYSSSVSTAVASNATYYEIATDGFEDYASNAYPTSFTPGHGHLTLRTSGIAPDLETDHAHSGKVSMNLDNAVDYNSIPVVTASLLNPNIPGAFPSAFSVVAGKKYTITAWVYSAAPGATPSVTVTNGLSTTSTIMPQKIEGWQHIETTFTAPSTGTISVHLQYTGGNGTERLDDIRIQPFESAMKTFVYDPVTLWLVATLDDRNFATFYSYDEEGVLVQVKSETEKGIFTSKTSRNNIHH